MVKKTDEITIYILEAFKNSFDLTNSTIHLYNRQTLKKLIMQNLLYTIAVIMVILWALGFFVYSTGNLIHILLVIAVIAVLLKLIKGKTI